MFNGTVLIKIVLFSRIFEFPDFREEGLWKTANFNHLIQLYEKELLMPVKLAYKLTHRVLFPGPIERQSVQLTSAVFTESTVEALKYYSRRGHPEFSETASFISLVLQWWKLVNSKSTFLSTKKRDSDREAVTKENLVEKTSFLRGFVDWLSIWEAQSCPEKRLSTETFQAAKHSSESLASIFEYLVEEAGLSYVLPIKFQNEKIEGRFGKLRQMCGGNLFASVRQFLESERSIKMMNLAHLNLEVADIDDIFVDAKNSADRNVSEASAQVLLELKIETEISLEPEILLSDKDALLYVSGCFARHVAKAASCQNCKNLILKQDLELSSGENDSFIAQVNRGGLTYPSELVFVICTHAWAFYTEVMKNPKTKKIIITNTSSRKVFTQSFIGYLNSSEDTRLAFVELCCEDGHCFDKHLSKFANKCFNIFSKNYVSVLNSKIHQGRKRIQNESKRDPSLMKSLKLQSDKF